MYSVLRPSPPRPAMRFARQPWFQLGESVQSAGWIPAMDIAETPAEYLVSLELPGVERDRVEVTYEQGLLRVTGEKAATREQSEPRLRRVERQYGAFERAVKVRGSVDADGISATFCDGVMTIRLPKAAEATARQILVTGAIPAVEEG